MIIFKTHHGHTQFIIIIIIIIIIITVITFMLVIYNYIPETNRVSRVYSVAAVLCLRFVLHVMLFRLCNVLYLHISTIHCMCAVPDMTIICSSLISCFPGMLHRYCLYDSEMLPVAPVMTGISFYSAHAQYFFCKVYSFKHSRLLS
jgi:heme/copper-type cytochrome/quinol oxidase subunit 4